MHTKLRDCLFRQILILSLLLHDSQEVTVKPSLCPTNKIAPHIRANSWNQRPRTFGSFSELFFSQDDYAGSLQEEPQQDDGDCDNIEDYDEYDLSSLAQPQINRKQGIGENRFFFGGLFPHFPAPDHQQPSVPNRPQYPQRPPAPSKPDHLTERPPRPPRPGQNRPTRPPYWSGGHFGNNPYRPPVPQYPSNNVKPVYEDTSPEDQVTYRPGVVGGPLGHIVGVSQGPIRPTTRAPLRRPNNNLYERPTTRRPRKLNSDTVLGSFIDLLL